MAKVETISAPFGRCMRSRPHGMVLRRNVDYARYWVTMAIYNCNHSLVLAWKLYLAWARGWIDLIVMTGLLYISPIQLL